MRWETPEKDTEISRLLITGQGSTFAVSSFTELLIITTFFGGKGGVGGEGEVK